MKAVIFLLALFTTSLIAATFEVKLQNLIQQDINYQQQREYLQYFQALKYAGYSKFAPSVSLNSVKNDQKLSGDYQNQTTRNSIDLNMDLFHFGQDYFNAGKTEKLYLAQKKMFSKQTLESQKQIGQLLLSYIEKSKSLEIRKEIIELKTRAYSIAKKRYETGQLSLQEVHKVEIDLNNTKALLENDFIQYNQIKGTISNYGLIEDLEIFWPWLSDYTKFENLSKKEVYLRSHPSYQFQKLTWEGQNLQRKSTISSLLGNLSLTYSRGQIANRLTEQDYKDESITLSFNIPLFNNFQQYAIYKKAVADEYLAATQLKNTQRNLFISYDASLKSLHAAIRTFKLRNKTLLLSQKLLDNTLKQFQSGRINVNDLILDQDRLLQTKLLANSGALALHIAMLDYCYATGQELFQECI